MKIVKSGYVKKANGVMRGLLFCLFEARIGK